MLAPSGQAGYAAALASLPGMGPATLHRLLSEAAPADVWDAVARAEVTRPPIRAREPHPSPPWSEVAARLDVAALWRAWAALGVEVTWVGDDRYPERLRRDPEPPGVLFWRGRIELLDARCVAVVGTRRATPDGRATAYDLGRDLAEAGISVVSGLALGIDGAAHLGALAARGEPGGAGGTVGVAASGVDVAYPARNAGLWERVAARGAVVSENPPGRPAQAWRFPSRNRVIAGVSEMVVVVESHSSGGSLITAEKAIERGIEVRVVPGPVHSPASAGSNQLLYDGPGPVRDATDVLDALGMLAPAPPRPRRRRRPAGLLPAGRPAPVGARPAPAAGQDRPTEPTATPPAPDRPRPVAPAPVTDRPRSVALHSVPDRPRPGAPAPVPDRSHTPDPRREDQRVAAPERPAADEGEGSTGPAPPPSATATGRTGRTGGAGRSGTPGRLDAVTASVLDAVGWRPTSLERVVERSGFGVGVVAAALEDLRERGLVADSAAWWSRVDPGREG